MGDEEEGLGDENEEDDAAVAEILMRQGLTEQKTVEKAW